MFYLFPFHSAYHLPFPEAKSLNCIGAERTAPFPKQSSRLLVKFDLNVHPVKCSYDAANSLNNALVFVT